MNYVSDEQKRAVMASLRNSGLLYPELDYNNSCVSFQQSVYNRKQTVSYKRAEQDFSNEPRREKELKVNEIKQRLLVIEKIKQILAIKVSVKYEEKLLLSQKYTDLISAAIRTDIDASIS